jgi:D-alanyl-D-alanine carboxypeptidase
MRLFRIAGAAFAVCLGLGSAASAAPPPRDGAPDAAQAAAIDRIARTVLERRATPSLVIAVAKHGALVFAKAYGYRNLDDRVLADTDTAYAIGSNTKQFTAAAILLLRDAGKLDVDAPVGRYLPGIAHGDQVTVRQLLTHTGGYAEYTSLDDIDRLGARPATNDEVLATVVSRPLGFTPGTKWQYSNTGYVMLTAIVERLSGLSYADFLRAKIFAPLGMSRSYVEDESVVVRDRATGYTRFALGAPEHEQHLDYSWFSGAGSIDSTAADLAKWNEAIDRGTLLSPGSRALMHTSMKLADGTDTHYGMGLFLQDLPGGKHAVFHGGDTTGMGTQDGRFVEDGFDVIVLTNQEPPAYNPIMNAVYAVLAGPPPRPVPTSTPAASGPAPAAAAGAQPAPPAASPGPAPSPKPIPEAKPEVDALARQWLDDAVAGKLDLSRLRPSSRATLRLARNQAALRGLATYGPRRYTLLNVDRRAPLSSYQYLLQTPKRTLLYIFSIDDDGTLAGGDVFDPNPLAPDPMPTPPAVK